MNFLTILPIKITQKQTGKSIRFFLHVLSQSLFLLIGCLNTPPLLAQDRISPTDHTELDISVLAHWRDQAVVATEQAWQIPGVLMGGEAVPAEENTQLDDVSVHLFHQWQSSWSVTLEVGSHDAFETLELEDVHLTYQFAPPQAHGKTGKNDHTSPLSNSRTLPHTHAYTHAHTRLHSKRLEMGRMSGVFTPSNATHADDQFFMDRPLVLDALLGGGLTDEGVRLITPVLLTDQALIAGIELWQGDAFPGSEPTTDPALDLFLHWQSTLFSQPMTVGIWALKTEANARSDTRYSSGHSHGSSIPAPSNPLIFSGSTDLQGTFFVWNTAVWDTAHTTALSGFLGLEWIEATTAGTVRDATHQAALDGTYHAFSIEPGLHQGRHAVHARFEQLILENTLTGAGASALATQAAFNNPGVNPTRTTWAYTYQLSRTLQTRLEYMNDRTSLNATNPATGLQTRNTLAVGVRWQERLHRPAK